MPEMVKELAALYAQNFRDQTVLSTVNEIEALTTSLSRKIWQKIIILNNIQKNNKDLAAE